MNNIIKRFENLRNFLNDTKAENDVVRIRCAEGKVLNKRNGREYTGVAITVIQKKDVEIEEVRFNEVFEQLMNFVRIYVHTDILLIKFETDEYLKDIFLSNVVVAPLAIFRDEDEKYIIVRGRPDIDVYECNVIEAKNVIRDTVRKRRAIKRALREIQRKINEIKI